MRPNSPTWSPHLSFLLLCLLPACGVNEQSEHIQSICDDSTNTSPFETGLVLRTADESFLLTLVSAQPTPLNRGNNTWVLSLKDGSEVPVPETSITLVPTMPGHGHGTHPTSFDGIAGEEPGLFTVGPFDLMMPGTWLLTFSITPSEGEVVIIESSFCIES